MNVFRLVLCLAGLAVYLLAKQFLPSTAASKSAPAAAVSPTAASVERLPVAPAPPRPAITPRVETLSAAPAVVGMKKTAE